MRFCLFASLVAVVMTLLGATPASAFLIQEKGGPQSATNGIVIGSDGNFWVAEEFSDSVVRMAPSGAVLGRWAVGSRPTSVANGPGNRVWVAVTGADKLVWFDASSPAPQPNNVPIAGPCGPVGLVAGNDGRMYFSLPHYAVPDTDVTCNAAASQIGSVPDTGVGGATLSPGGAGTVYDLHVHGGKLYAPDFEGDVVRRLSLAATPIVEASVATSAGSGPDGVTADGAGNIWITEWISGKVARFPADQNGGSAVEFGPPGGGLANPFGIVAGADGRMYVAGKGSANIARVTPDGVFALYSLPDSEPFNIINGTDGDLWFTDQKKTRILRLVNSAPRVATGVATAIGPNAGSVQASVDPRGNDTQVVFDYGPTAAYGATSAPVTLPIAAGPVPVTSVLTGLAPSTTYHVRVRASNAEGSLAGTDTTFATPTGDADGDGVAVPRDCNDANPAIRPGAVDKPRDRIDQDCSGSDADYPELTATTTFGFDWAATTVILRIEVSRLRGGETATMRCTGRRCPFKTKRFTKLKRGKRAWGRSLLRGRRLAHGATISVRVTRPRFIGTSTVLRVRRNKRPVITRACVRPGATKVSRCP
jgi:sugar lactone lactonase YvrE